MNKKQIGSFYTPKIIADFMVDYLAKKLQNKTALEILEPSSGDGIFIRTLYNHAKLSSKLNNVIAIEREEEEVEKVREITKNNSLKAIHIDFLEFQDNNVKFDLVIGNPPYIKKNRLSELQVELCENIHKSFSQLSNKKIKNIWTAFLVRSINFIKQDGVLAFVLPSELLQVKFAEELRNLILDEFERVEIFTFNELLFKDCKGQDTLLLIAERKSKKKGIYYTNIEKVTDLKTMNFSLTQNIKSKESKWTHSHLVSEEIELLEKLKTKLVQVDELCTSKAGIVTAANNYFIVNSEVLEKYSLQNYVKPIIQKGVFVNGSVELNHDDFQKLINTSKPTYLIALDDDITYHNNELKQYLAIGIETLLHERFKMKKRKNWYRVPNVGSPPEAFFFKRCNEYPKLIKNNAKVLATDSAYTIMMKDDFKIEDLIFSFYNSLTLSLAELNGRYYGGGVLELTPNEFKGLSVPYINTSPNEFSTFVCAFKGKSSIKEICKRNDFRILKSIDKNLDNDTIEKIYNIREKLYLRRIKTN
jgi:adenine-specific DNA-methyltransferase